MALRNLSQGASGAPVSDARCGPPSRHQLAVARLDFRVFEDESQLADAWLEVFAVEGSLAQTDDALNVVKR